MLDLLLVLLVDNSLLVEGHGSVSALATASVFDPSPADQLADKQTDHADCQADEDTSHDGDEDGNNALEEGMCKSVSVVRTVGTGRTVVAMWSVVRACVRWHTALKLAVTISIRSTEVRVNVAGHLMRRATLAATAAAAELAETALLGSLELLINGVEEAA